jgi:hypothetical protein
MARYRTDSFLTKQLPVAAFASFTLGGSLFIAVSKFYGVNAFVSMAVPILLMFGYLALSYIAGRLRLHDEQTGDNLYYMGFLFTLTSLAVSLYQFSASGSTEEVVRNFGIAITSTITGIGLRILYNQMRRDVLDIERATRHELSDMTRRVRAELEGISREFADFRRVSNQMLEEGFGEIAVQADRTGGQIREAMEKLAMEAIKPVQESSAKFGTALENGFGLIEAKFTSIAEKMGTSADVLDKANSAMTASVSQLGSQVESVAKKLESVTIPDEVLKHELAPLVRELGVIVADYGRKTEAASREQQARVAEIAEAVSKVADRADKSLAAIEKSTETAGHIQRVTENLFRLAQRQSAEIESLVGKLSEDRRAMPATNTTDLLPVVEPPAAANGHGLTDDVDTSGPPVQPVEVPKVSPALPGMETANGDGSSKRWWQLR